MFLSEEFLHKIILQEVNQNVAFTIDRYHIESAFNRLNKICFNGRLKPCSINLKLPKNYLGFFKYDGYDNNNQLINPTIYINGQYQYTTVQFESVLAHEMIHYWLAMIGADPKCTHGTEFKQMVNQINSQCNLNIDERVDTGGMTYSPNSNGYKPSQQIIGKLRGYYQALQQYTSQMKNDIGNKSGNIGIFIQTLYSFNIALMDAINRCVKKNSLNEGGEFTRAINNFSRGYNKWSDWMTDVLTKKGNTFSNSSRSGKASSYNNNVTLMRLLFTTFPYEIEKKFDAVNKTTMNALSSIGYVDATMQTIRQMGQEVETEMQNAQGANP